MQKYCKRYMAKNIAFYKKLRYTNCEERLSQIKNVFKIALT